MARASACSLLLASLLIDARAQSADVLSWLDTQLSADLFVGYNGQQRRADGTWERVRIAVDATKPEGPKVLMYQPFRSKVNHDTRKIYVRKDESRNLGNSWYGEIWYYDATNIYVHSETFPLMPDQEPGTAWDQRPERFRLFVDRSDGTKGRLLAPRLYTRGWVAAQTIDTYMCGVSAIAARYAKTDGWLQANAKTCPLYQKGVRDEMVTVTMIERWDAYEPGMSLDTSGTAIPPGSEFVQRLPRVWDKVLVISQYMPWNNGFARERFMMGFHEGVHHGLIAWDDGWGPDISHISVNARAVPEVLLRRTAGTMDYLGMLMRDQRDRTLPPPAPPTNLRVECIANSPRALLSWDGVDGATAADVRVDDLADAWSPASPLDTVLNRHPANSSIIDTAPGHRYNWWVHAVNEAGSTPAAGAPSTFVGCGGSMPAPPRAPAGTAVKVVGDIATLSWEPTYAATSYAVRIDDLSDPWQPGSGGNDVVVNGHRATSLLVQIKPGHAYNWWVHAANDAGTSVATGGPVVRMSAP